MVEDAREKKEERTERNGTERNGEDRDPRLENESSGSIGRPLP
jgi:hypothetical protein